MMFLALLDKRKTKGDVIDEMTIHHIIMDPIDTVKFAFFHFIFNVRKVR